MAKRRWFPGKTAAFVAFSLDILIAPQVRFRGDLVNGHFPAKSKKKG